MAIQKNTSALLKQLGLPYTCVINSTMDLLKDPAVLGIYVYLQSKPATWEIKETELMNRFGKGRDFIRERLKKLRDAGLLVAKTKRNEKGHITGWTVILYSHLESQITKSAPKDKPSAVETPTEEPLPEEPEVNQQEEPNPPDDHKKDEATIPITTVLRENPTHIKERDLFLVKKETTTTDEVVFSETIDDELIRLRNEHMPNDERTIEEFVSQCKWHLQKGDAKKYTFYQRIAGLKKLIQQKRFETPASYPGKKKITGVSDIVLYNQYYNGIKSDIALRLLPDNTAPMSFEEWKKQG